MDSGNWEYERLKYCRIESTPEGLKYFSLLGGTETEVTKDIYDVIEHSYHKEFLMDLARMGGKTISLNQLAEEIEDYERHGSVPVTLQCPSAEEQFFMQTIPELDEIVPAKIASDYEQLDPREKKLVLSYAKDPVYKKEIAEQEDVSERTIRRHREQAAAKIRDAYQRRHGNNE